MQIDLVITELNVGGAERTLTRLAIGLKDRGDEVRVFSLGPLPTPELGALVSDLQAHGIEIESGQGRGIADLGSVYRKLRSWLRLRPAALRQSFLFHANVLTKAALPAPERRNWVAGVRVADPNRPRIVIEGQALRSAAKVVCVSSAVAEFAQQQYRLPSSELSVIGNAVETERFASAVPLDWRDFGWPADIRVVLFLGRLHTQKNIALLQRTLDRFAPAGSNVRLAIVGSGALGADLRRWADGVPGDRVGVLDWQPNIPALIAASTLLVLPSHYEGMPNVVMEAMAGGKPVVCSRVEGSLELIGDAAEQGFDLGDDEQFVAKVNHFLNDADFAARVGAKNQQRMNDLFSVQRMVNTYRGLYETIGEGRAS
ncbi:glycosyltransferase [Allorhodopirellula solitaria]|uniref:Putative teichuronic acid biosynthesis glycosyltransferase TuaC n=1 Tax=Allorhodopirellula solitaria TaxID=2527987 RepID=A0A5C5XU67_9BACT|nr:glycosyltransferase [Allorhodopirellula solitaria]TWT66450.1 putative teichuronic acid biosynthesis glycosyltransferase TuaC [Allorhodopirellula solitaria]